MGTSFFTQEAFGWGLGLVIGLPILIIALGEIIDRLDQRKNPLARGVRQIRHVVLPVFAALFIMRAILSMADSERAVQLVGTLFWVTVAYAMLTLVRNLSQFGDLNPSSWVMKIPTLFFALVRGLAVFFILSHILSGIWGVDLSNLKEVLGFGSLAIALAVQDTVGNIVSGFLMMADRPFKVGDWVNVGGEWMEVQSMTWRTTRLGNFTDGGSIVIPNGTLANEKIINYGQQGTPYQHMIFATFSYDDPPNVVKQVLQDICSDIDGIVSEPSIITYGYEDLGIKYRITCMIDFWDWVSVWDAFHTQLYYAAKRNGLTLARPTEFQGELDDLKPKLSPQTIADMLRTKPLFESLDADTINWLASGTRVHDYAANENIMKQGEPDDGFYAIETGEVVLTVQDQAGHTHNIAHLSAGEFFGEMALIRNEPSPVSAAASTDVYLLITDGHMITQLLETNPQFALELNYFIEKRQATIAAITGSQNGQMNQTARHDWVDMVRRV